MSWFQKILPPENQASGGGTQVDAGRAVVEMPGL